MSVQVGYLDSNGHPRIRIRVHGPDPAIFTEEDALIDTGFTGFLMLPQTKAFSLGIVPTATSNYTLADDSTVTNFVADGTVVVGHILPPDASCLPDHVETAVRAAVATETISGVVVMCGNGALVGMDFVSRLKKLLLVGEFVIMLDHDVVTDLLTQFPKPSDPSGNPPTN